MLKRGTFVTMLTMLLLMLFPTLAHASQVVFTVGSTTFSYAGKNVTMDVPPSVKHGRVYLPLRYVAQAIGVSSEGVVWDQNSNTVYLTNQGKTVQVRVGSSKLLVNGTPISMDVVPEVSSGRVMLPIRWIALAFGLNVDWDPSTATIILENPKPTLTVADIIEMAKPAIVVIETNRAEGSGFFWSTDGEVITNAHVVAGSSSIIVRTFTGAQYSARIKKLDAYLDLAILKVDGGPFQIIPYFSTQFKQGEEVMAFGSPLGLKDSVSKGIISAVRDISEVDSEKRGIAIIQTDAVTLPGSSGGPLLNMNGEVIGILFAGKGIGLGVNFAIPISYYFSVEAKPNFGLKDDFLLYLEEDKQWAEAHNDFVKLSEQVNSFIKDWNTVAAIQAQQQLLVILQELVNEVASYSPQTPEMNNARLIYLEALRNYYQGNAKILESLQLSTNILTISRAQVVLQEAKQYIDKANQLVARYNETKNKLHLQLFGSP